MNLRNGDKFTNKQWSSYYEMPKKRKGLKPLVGPKEPKFGNFQVGSIIGVYVDIERGMINFFKDGNDLGQAFFQKELRTNDLYPFVQLEVECKMSIFQPFVYPLYWKPGQADES
jgi:hypothetical protein